jgi:hypothetical protein
MWICARCGTEAQQPEMCSGCGSIMRPLGEPPKEDRYKFVLIERHMHDGDLLSNVYGPFPSVIAADMWADATLKHHDYEVVLMEAPEDGT